MIGLSVKSRSNASAIAAKIAKRKSEILRQFATDTIEIAKQSMKPVPLDSRQVSTPGQPPFVRSSPPNLTSLSFRLKRDEVTVSPLRRNTASGSIPDVIERGGYLVRRSRGRRRQVRYYVQARPYIRPAARKAIDRLHRNVKQRGIS